MKTKTLTPLVLPCALAASLLAGGCSKQASQQGSAAPQQTQAAPNAAGQQAMNPESAPSSAVTAAPTTVPTQQALPSASTASRSVAGSSYAAAPRPAEPASYTIPAGTSITVTTREELSSKTSQPGQSFSATVTNDVRVRGVTLVRAGSTATGTVVAAKSQGRFKGSGELDLRLDSIRAEGRSLEIATNSIDQEQKGKGKRTAGFVGGGGGGGALIGGLAGGGKGALIGGLLGAGAGTAGAAFTGNKPVIVPAESPLTFRLVRSVTVTR